VLTPSQTAGPFLTIGLIDGPITNHLVDESDPRAIRITGVLLDGAGDPVTDGMVEIWQANATGRYAHPADDREDVPLEDGFWGFGRSSTADGGRFDFVTLKPGRVPWVDGHLQAPHLLVGVFARGLLKRVATRMYFPDEEAANAEDPLLLALEPAERTTLVARAEDGTLRFDIVLQGSGHTTFFAV
jgi:protocatechuate 3,4-dioxygenase alpha subunit